MFLFHYVSFIFLAFLLPFNTNETKRQTQEANCRFPGFIVKRMNIRETVMWCSLLQKVRKNRFDMILWHL